MGLLSRRLMVPDERYIVPQQNVKQGGAIEQIPTWWNDRPAYPIVNFENNVRSGYRANELIYACIGTKAATAASAHLRVCDDEGDGMDDHPLQLLINQPNKFYTEVDMIGMIIMHLDLAGRSYWQKLRSRRGQVVELWPLRPDWVRPIRSRADFISAYEYNVPGLQPQRLPADDILDFRLADPLDFFNGYSPVSTAMRVASVDNSVTDYLELFFRNGGIPPGILTTKSQLDDLEVENIRRRWRERYAGVMNWLAPAVIDHEVTYQKTGLDFDEMGFEAIDARTEARICAILGVPAVLVGAQVGLANAHLSNMQEAQHYLWHNTLMPMYKRIANEIATDLLREFPGNAEIEWDFSDVAALQENTDAIWTRAIQALNAGGITRNDFREEIGYEADAVGDVYYIPSGVMVVPADATPDDITAASAPPEPSPSTEPQGESEMEMDEEDMMPGGAPAEQEKPAKARKHKRGFSGRKAKQPRYYRARIDKERAMQLALERFFPNQLERVMNEIDALELE